MVARKPKVASRPKSNEFMVTRVARPFSILTGMWDVLFLAGMRLLDNIKSVHVRLGSFAVVRCFARQTAAIECKATSCLDQSRQ